MANRPDSTGLLDGLNFTEVTFDPRVDGGEALERHDLTVLRTDGKYYKSSASAGAQFAGWATQKVLLTDTEAILIDDDKVLRLATVAVDDTTAINARAMRIKGSGGSDALVQTDLGADVYGEDSLTLVLVAGATTGVAKVGYIARIDVVNQTAFIRPQPFNGVNAP